MNTRVNSESRELTADELAQVSGGMTTSTPSISEIVVTKRLDMSSPGAIRE
jgi:bacteriocin-like protein